MMLFSREQHTLVIWEWKVTTESSYNSNKNAYKPTWNRQDEQVQSIMCNIGGLRLKRKLRWRKNFLHISARRGNWCVFSECKMIVSDSFWGFHSPRGKTCAIFACDGERGEWEVVLMEARCCPGWSWSDSGGDVREVNTEFTEVKTDGEMKSSSEWRKLKEIVRENLLVWDKWEMKQGITVVSQDNIFTFHFLCMLF